MARTCIPRALFGFVGGGAVLSFSDVSLFDFCFVSFSLFKLSLEPQPFVQLCKIIFCRAHRAIPGVFTWVIPVPEFLWVLSILL